MSMPPICMLSSSASCMAAITWTDTRVISSGETPLHYAIHVQQPNIISVLLAKGADKHVTDNKGKVLVVTRVLCKFSIVYS
jgi:ankyrin repeat protein